MAYEAVVHAVGLSTFEQGVPMSRNKKTAVFLGYMTLLAVAGVLFYLELLGMLPMLMILAASFGLAHLGYSLLLADADDYLDDLHEERGGKRKTVAFFHDGP